MDSSLCKLPVCVILLPKEVSSWKTFLSYTEQKTMHEQMLIPKEAIAAYLGDLHGIDSVTSRQLTQRAVHNLSTGYARVDVVADIYRRIQNF